MGLIKQRCVIRGSVIGMRTRIADEVIVEDSIIVGSDIYEVNRVSWTGNKTNKSHISNVFKQS